MIILAAAPCFHFDTGYLRPMPGPPGGHPEKVEQLQNPVGTSKREVRNETRTVQNNKEGTFAVAS